jgi:hypothetical protein
MKKIICLFLFSLLFSCNTPDRLLPKGETGWNLSRSIEELSLDNSLIDSEILEDVGRMVFLESGEALLTLPDSSQQNYQWAYDDEENEMLFPDLVYEGLISSTVIRQEGFSFNILESKSKEQLWRAEVEQKIFNPFTQDSGLARIVIQWKLDRE